VPDARLSDDPMANPFNFFDRDFTPNPLRLFSLALCCATTRRKQLTAVDGYVSNSWLKSSFWNGLAAIIYGIRSSPGCVGIKTLRRSEKNSRSYKLETRRL